MQQVPLPRTWVKEGTMSHAPRGLDYCALQAPHHFFSLYPRRKTIEVLCQHFLVPESINNAEVAIAKVQFHISTSRGVQSPRLYLLRYGNTPFFCFRTSYPSLCTSFTIFCPWHSPFCPPTLPYKLCLKNPDKNRRYHTGVQAFFKRDYRNVENGDLARSKEFVKTQIPARPFQLHSIRCK